MTVRVLVALAGLLLNGVVLQGGEPAKKVLIIGIDGCRTDALKAARAPNLHTLIRDGTFAEKTRVLAERPTGADTVSGPGWASILTGVWADKHGVRDNRFEGANFQQFPHFFARLKQARPTAFTASYVTWEPIQRRMVTAADDSLAVPQGNEPHRDSDARGVRKTIALLKTGNPDVVFLHLDHVDGAGHAKGFSPQVREYLQAIEQVDVWIGQILEAMRQRKTYAQEDWLTVVCTDHGGKGTGHGRGHKVPEIREVFLIVSGPSAAQAQVETPTYLVDVAATALTHLGVALDPSWKLDGRPVGLKVKPRSSTVGG
jgi:predicted AlkP superfamily pyrophosphatase or phosphodiesterase